MKETTVVIIGGGATGTGILRDLAMRGVRALLFEMGSVANGTSSRFHGLLHSGARYAVSDNEAAAECLLRTLRAYRPTRLVAVFGCGGARSRLRRFGMGSVCARLADFCIITEDNSRGEPVEHILADIRAGLRLGNPATPFAEIPDRRQAIYYALDHAQPGDIIAILGKGHETTIERGGIKEPFVEREIVEEYWGR